MANNNIEFEQSSPEWQAEGAQPREELKAEGFQAGYRPPAAYFNWFWTCVSRCIKELQDKVKAYVVQNEADKESDRLSLSQHTQSKNNPHGVTAAQVGLGKVNNTSDDQKWVYTSDRWSGKSLGWTEKPPLHYFLMGGTGAEDPIWPVPASYFLRNTDLVQVSNLAAGGTVMAKLGGINQVVLGGDFTNTGIDFRGSDGVTFIKGVTAVWCMKVGGVSFSPIVASAFTQSSSVRFKENIESLSASFAEKIMQLRPVRYTLKNNEHDTRHKFGLIAEEVEHVFPEMVAYQKDLETEEMLVTGLEYQMLLAPMILLLQQQKEAIQNLEKRVQVLEQNAQNTSA